MGRPIKKGSTDQSTVIRILDSTTFLPETAVEYDTAGIDLWFRREQETKTSITEAALAALDSAHSDGGIEHIGDGYYRLDMPDAACAAGSGENSVQFGGTVTGMVVIGNEHALVDYDPYDTVRLGLTALPAAAADAAGGLPISDAGGLALDTQLANTNEITAARMGALTDWINGGRLDLILDIIAADTTTDIPAKLLKYVQLLARSDAAIETDNATELTAINADGGSGGGDYSAQTDSGEANRDHVGDGTNLTEAGGDGDHLTAINLPNQTMDIVGNITGNLSGSVGSLTGHTNQTADHTAGIADIPTVAEFNARSLPSADYVVVGDTIAGVTTVTNLTNAPTNGDLTATMKASVNTEADTALSDIHLDHLFQTNYDPASKPGSATALLNELIENDGGVSRFTENALEQAPSGSGGDATEAKQDIIITHLTDVKGATWASGTDTLEAIRDRGDAAWTTGSGGTAGAGSETWVYTLTDDDTGNPIGDADVWVSTDAAGSSVVASGTTDQSGNVTFYLDTGTVYVWRQKSGWNFTNPDTETVA